MNTSLTAANIRSKDITTTSELPVSEEEMMQAVRTLLLGMGEDPDREGLIELLGNRYNT